MNQFTFYSPTRVIFGKEAENQAGAMAESFNAAKVLLHYGTGSVIRSGLLNRVKKSLEEKKIEYVMLGGVVPNPKLSLVKEGIRLCKEEKVDFILAVGGGSVLDSAKAIALGAVYEGDVWDFFSQKAVPEKGLAHGNIITLAATGSEMSSSAVITNDETGEKRGVNCDFNRPAFALMNPELTYTLPPYQTACGIADIMMHTMERYFSKGGENEMTDCIAEQVLKTVIKYGRICLKDPVNYEARSEVMWAGSLSHNHLTGLGRNGDWACHQLEHELSGMFDVAHGAGLSAIWTSWAYYVCEEDIMRFARFGVKVWDVPMNENNPKETAYEAIRRTKEYFESLNLPVTITELMGRPLTKEEIKQLAYKCAFNGKRTIGNFMVLKQADMERIYCNAL